MNIYTATEAELASIEKIGEVSAKKLINLRNEVRLNIRRPLTSEDLAEVRLTKRIWETKLEEGEVSLDLPPNFVRSVGTEETKEKQASAMASEYVTTTQLEGVMKTITESHQEMFKYLDKISHKMDFYQNRVEENAEGIVVVAKKVAELESGLNALALKLPEIQSKKESSEDLKPPNMEEFVSKLGSVFPKSGIYMGKTKKDDHNPSHRYSRSRSPSPQRPKMDIFTGDPSKDLSWANFITKFERQVGPREWSDDRKLNRLFNCLSGTALEFANRCAGQDDYHALVKEMGQRFDLRDTPVGARQKLHIIKQTEDESLEVFLQRVMTVAIDGFGLADNTTLQNIATEAFLRGCRHKEAAAAVLNEGPANMQIACQRIKTLVANKKAIYGTSTKVTFQERAFTVEEERRVYKLEKAVESLQQVLRGHSGPTSPDRFQRPRSPELTSPRNAESRGRPYGRGRSYPQARSYNRPYSPSPTRGFYRPGGRSPSPSQDGPNYPRQTGFRRYNDFPQSSQRRPSNDRYEGGPRRREDFRMWDSYNSDEGGSYHYPHGYPYTRQSEYSAGNRQQSRSPSPSRRPADVNARLAQLPVSDKHLNSQGLSASATST